MQNSKWFAYSPQQTLTADLSDAYDAARVIPRQFINYGDRSACIGPVETISTTDDNSLVSTTLKEPGDGRILVVNNSGSTNCAMVGGDLARAAHENNWQGIIVNGAIRDVVELRDVPIAIFALTSCPRKSQKRDIGVRGEPTRIKDIVIRRNDIAAADQDGVVIIDASLFGDA